MVFSREVWIFFGLSCIEFLFLICPAIFFKITHRESLKTSILSRSFPHKQSILVRFGDVVTGILSGIFLSFLAQGLLYGTYLSIIGLFGENFYNTASSGSIDVIPTTVSIAESIFMILIYFLIIGVCEEYFFRSVLFVELKKMIKNWSYIINGIIFGLYHVFPGVVPIQTTITFFPYYFLLGILLCVLLEVQKNDLLSNIIAHGVFNALPLIISFF